MYKRKSTGFYEDDFRRDGYLPDGGDFRLHLSYGVATRGDAKPLADAIEHLVDGKHFDVLELVRRGTVTPRQVADHIAEDKPIGLLRERAPEPVPAVEPWPSVRAAADAMLEWIDANPNKSKGTHAEIRGRYRKFCAFLEAHPELTPEGERTRLDEIRTAVVEQYQSELIAAEFAPNTITNYVMQVGALYRWQSRREHRAAREAGRPERVLHIPLDPETAARGRTRRQRFLYEAEAERLLEACPEPLLFPVACGLFAGLRVDEMLHLRPAFDVDLRAGLFIIQPQPTWMPKSKKRREVPIAEPLRPLLERHLDQYASEDWLVPAINDPTKPGSVFTFTAHFKRVVEDAELPYGRKNPKGIVYHTLRHTFASWLVMRGVDLYTVAQLLGNSLKMVEDTYAHLAPDFRQRAVDRLKGAIAVPIRFTATTGATEEPANV